MSTEQAKSKVQRELRRYLSRHTGWISVDNGATRCDCAVLDVSPGGARVVTDLGIDIGDTFGLTLVPSRPQSRNCEVVWRRGTTFGVKFLS
jgi:PilZ domain